ncbi:hypothetical protein Ccrd_026636, partial [Cynara cardunculus var. scolymus]
MASGGQDLILALKETIRYDIDGQEDMKLIYGTIVVEESGNQEKDVKVGDVVRHKGGKPLLKQQSHSVILSL